MAKKMIKLGKKKTIQYLKHQKIFGLPNLGNTCYANSVLQLIMRNPKNNAHYTFSWGNKLSYILNKLIKYSFRLKNNRTYLIKILLNLFKEMKKLNDYYSLLNEHDVSVFFKDLMNGLEKEPDNKYDSNSPSDYYSNYLYEGKKENKFKCSLCEYSEKYVENFFDLNLNSLINFSSNTNLRLEKYFAEEKLSEFYCSNCNRLVVANVNKKIIKFPDTLVITNNSKDEKLGSFISVNEHKYKLYGFILYNEENKHYVSNSISDLNEETIIDDEEIKTELDFTEYKVKMMFYNKLF